MKELFFWLICNTSIDNSSQITNHELKHIFLEAYPDYINSNHNGKISGLIGMFLYSIYSTDLVKEAGSNRSITYNLRVHRKPVKEIIIRNLE